MQEQILKDPDVIEALQNAGSKALSDPKVQEEILRVAKEKAPELATKPVTMVQAWAQNPEVQAKAKYMAGVAIQYTGHAGEYFVHCIEQGPEGVQILSFIAGVASLVLAILQVINPLELLGATFTYVISLYQVIFSLMTMLFEAKTEWVSQYEFVSQLQDILMLNMRFLTLTLGRGLFYIFQGSIWWVLSTFYGIPQKLLGLFMCFLGALYILMHFGIMPQHVATKMKNWADEAGYVRVTD